MKGSEDATEPQRPGTLTSLGQETQERKTGRDEKGKGGRYGKVDWKPRQGELWVF
jgi:hypothetical protein